MHQLVFQEVIFNNTGINLTNSTLSGYIDVNVATDKLKINVFNNVPENPDNAMPSNVNIGFSGMYIIK